MCLDELNSWHTFGCFIYLCITLTGQTCGGAVAAERDGCLDSFSPLHALANEPRPTRIASLDIAVSIVYLAKTAASSGRVRSRHARIDFEMEVRTARDGTPRSRLQ